MPEDRIISHAAELVVPILVVSIVPRAIYKVNTSPLKIPTQNSKYKLKTHKKRQGSSKQL